MAFKYSDSGAAATVFLGIFILVLPFALLTMFKHGIKSFYSVTILFVLVRIGSQTCGVVFAVVGFEHQNWLTAYLVLGAEGYFFLIICLLNVLISGHVKKYGFSWLTKYGINGDIRQQVTMGKRGKLARKSWAVLFHTALVPANILVIAGGAILSGISASDLQKESGDVTTAKILRTVGQLVFLLLTSILILLALASYTRDNVKNWAVVSVLAASPFILTRGIFGLLSIYIKSMDYFDMSNYGDFGIGNSLIIYEYCLGTTMELLCLLCILLNYFDAPAYSSRDFDSEDNLLTLSKGANFIL